MVRAEVLLFGSPLCPQGIGQEEMNAKSLHSGVAAFHMFLQMEVAGNASGARGSN
jgi:hypothetical protein